MKEEDYIGSIVMGCFGLFFYPDVDYPGYTCEYCGSHWVEETISSKEDLEMYAMAKAFDNAELETLRQDYLYYYRLVDEDYDISEYDFKHLIIRLAKNGLTIE